MTGGKIKLSGNYFRSDFYGASLTCKIGNTVVPGELLNASFIGCNFQNGIEINEKNNYVQLALNNVSYTPKTPTSKISVFDADKIRPSMGIVQGGTPVNFLVL